MEIKNTSLTELEQEKVKKMLCPKCNDGLREFTNAKADGSSEQWVACVNYYCRWEVCVSETSE